MRVYPELTVDGEFQALGDLGYTGTLNDRQYNYLSYLGFTGALSDLLYAWNNNPFVPYIIEGEIPSLVADMTIGAVYQHLTDLETKGLIKATQKGKRKELEITERGKRALEALDDLQVLL